MKEKEEKGDEVLEKESRGWRGNRKDEEMEAFWTKEEEEKDGHDTKFNFYRNFLTEKTFSTPPAFLPLTTPTPSSLSYLVGREVHISKASELYLHTYNRLHPIPLYTLELTLNISCQNHVPVVGGNVVQQTVKIKPSERTVIRFSSFF